MTQNSKSENFKDISDKINSKIRGINILVDQFSKKYNLLALKGRFKELPDPFSSVFNDFTVLFDNLLLILNSDCSIQELLDKLNLKHFQQQKSLENVKIENNRLFDSFKKTNFGQYNNLKNNIQSLIQENQNLKLVQQEHDSIYYTICSEKNSLSTQYSSLKNENEHLKERISQIEEQNRNFQDHISFNLNISGTYIKQDLVQNNLNENNSQMTNNFSNQNNFQNFQNSFKALPIQLNDTEDGVLVNFTNGSTKSIQGNNCLPGIKQNGNLPNAKQFDTNLGQKMSGSLGQYNGQQINTNLSQSNDQQINANLGQNNGQQMNANLPQNNGQQINANLGHYNNQQMSGSGNLSQNNGQQINANLSHEVDNLNKKLQQCKANYDRLMYSYQSLVHKNKHLETENSRFLSENKNLQIQLQKVSIGKQYPNHKLNELDSIIKTQQNTIQQLQSNKHNLEGQINQQKLILQDQQNKILQYENDRKNILHQIQNQQNRIQQLENSEAQTNQKEQINLLKLEIERLNNQIEQFEKEKNEFDEKINSIENDKNELKNNFEIKLNEKNDQINNLTIKCQELEKDISNEKENINNLNNVIKEISIENQKLKDDVDASKKMVETYKKQIKFQKEIINKQMVLAKNETENQIKQIKEIHNKEIKILIETLEL